MIHINHPFSSDEHSPVFDFALPLANQTFFDQLNSTPIEIPPTLSLATLPIKPTPSLALPENPPEVQIYDQNVKPVKLEKRKLSKHQATFREALDETKVRGPRCTAY